MPGAKCPSEPLGYVMADLTPKDKRGPWPAACLCVIVCVRVPIPKDGTAAQHNPNHAGTSKTWLGSDEEREMSEQRRACIFHEKRLFFFESSNGKALIFLHRNSTPCAIPPFLSMPF